jgi:hypothetical protein
MLGEKPSHALSLQKLLTSGLAEKTARMDPMSDRADSLRGEIRHAENCT